MKKSIFTAVLFIMILSGCGQTNNQENEKAEVINEATLIDSISTVLDQAIIEIEESEEKLDELLKEL